MKTCELKNSGNYWYRHLHDELLSMGFQESEVDKNFYIKTVYITLYRQPSELTCTKDPQYNYLAHKIHLYFHN
jgi:hypothetical protein